MEGSVVFPAGQRSLATGRGNSASRSLTIGYGFAPCLGETINVGHERLVESGHGVCEDFRNRLSAREGVSGSRNLPPET